MVRTDPKLLRLRFQICLEASPAFWASTEEARAVICNGAGAKGGLKFPNTFYGLNVRPAFDIHDWDYEEGGTERDRDVADYRMLRNLLVLIEYHTTPIFGVRQIMLWLRGIRANSYFRAVREFGRKAFSYD